jgi:hypothetical protein
MSDDALKQLPVLRVSDAESLRFEREAVALFRARGSALPLWALAAERWILQSSALGFFGWAFVRAFLP